MRLDGGTTPPISITSSQKTENTELVKAEKKRVKREIKTVVEGFLSVNTAKSTLKNDFPLNCSPIIESNKVTIFLNIRTYSEAQTIPVKKKNGKYTTEHWTAKHKRHKKQKNSIFWAYMEVRQFVKYPCTITFVRYAPKTLDKHDNLPMSMKWLCDALCAEITGEHRPGLADNFEGLTIKYDQVKSKVYGVKIIIEF